MSKWEKELDLHDVWNADMPEKDIPSLGKVIAERLKMLFPTWGEDEELRYIVEEMDDIITIEQGSMGDHCFASPTEHFDSVMRRLYDFADKNKLWISIPF